MDDDPVLKIIKEEFEKTDNPELACLNAFVGIGKLVLSKYTPVNEAHEKLITDIFGTVFLAGNVRTELQKSKRDKNFNKRFVIFYKANVTVQKEVKKVYASLGDGYTKEVSAEDLAYVLALFEHRCHQIVEAASRNEPIQADLEETEQIQSLLFQPLAGLMPYGEFEKFRAEFHQSVLILFEFKNLQHIKPPNSYLM